MYLNLNENNYPVFVTPPPPFLLLFLVVIYVFVNSFSIIILFFIFIFFLQLCLVFHVRVHILFLGCCDCYLCGKCGYLENTVKSELKKNNFFGQVSNSKSDVR